MKFFYSQSSWCYHLNLHFFFIYIWKESTRIYPCHSYPDGTLAESDCHQCSSKKWKQKRRNFSFKGCASRSTSLLHLSWKGRPFSEVMLLLKEMKKQHQFMSTSSLEIKEETRLDTLVAWLSAFLKKSIKYYSKFIETYGRNVYQICQFNRSIQPWNKIPRLLKYDNNSRIHLFAEWFLKS